jgi:hypothetical protein
MTSDFQSSLTLSFQPVICQGKKLYHNVTKEYNNGQDIEKFVSSFSEILQGYSKRRD